MAKKRKPIRLPPSMQNVGVIAQAAPRLEALEERVLLSGSAAPWSGDGAHLDHAAAAQASPPQPFSAASDVSIALSSTPTDASWHQNVTFTASVIPIDATPGTPGGSVTFMDGAAMLGSVSLVNGVAIFSTTSLLLGPHTITAIYSGDGAFNAAASAPYTQLVYSAATTTSLSSSAPAAVWGQPVTWTASVAVKAPAIGTPIGKVQFVENGTVLATVPLDSSGIARYTPAALAVGTHAITAVFISRSNSFGGSRSIALNQSVSKASTSLALGGVPNAVIPGQVIAMSASVGVLAPGAGAPTGVVTFFDGATALGTVSLNGSQATYSGTLSGAGDHIITAVYDGDADFQASSSSASSVHVAASGSLAFVQAAYNVNETAGTLTLNVTRTAGSEGSVSVDYAVSGGSGVAGVDYMLPGGTLNFADGQTSQSITLNILDDGKFGPNHTVVVTLSNPAGGASVGPIASTTITIKENEPAPILAASNASITMPASGTDSLTFTVTLTGATTLPATLGYATSNASAVAGVDYTAASGAVTFAPGQTTQTISVPINGGSAPGPNKVFNLFFSNPANATLATPAVTGTIVNPNDTPPTIGNVSVLYAPGAAVTLNPMGTAHDADGDRLTFAVVTQPRYGALAVNADGTVTYSALPGDIAPDSFTYQVSDGRGGVAGGTGTVTPWGLGLEKNPFNPNLTDLAVMGTAGNDIIRFKASGGSVNVIWDGQNLGNYQPTGRIVANGLGGDDQISLVNVGTSAWLYGGDGNDSLTGGGGNDFLVGGEGNDTLDGGAGRNALVGGDGADVLRGHGTSDLLIAGSTVYDDPTVANQTALLTVLSNWTSRTAQSARTRIVAAGASGASSPHLSSSTITDDGSADVLVGNRKSWLFGLDNTAGGNDIFYQGKKRINGAQRHALMISEV
jgi:hypothetical protein